MPTWRTSRSSASAATAQPPRPPGQTDGSPFLTCWLVHACLVAAIVPTTTEDATGTLGERAAERRGQAHQPLEPDLGKPRGAHDAPASRRTSVGNAAEGRRPPWSSFGLRGGRSV